MSKPLERRSSASRLQRYERALVELATEPAVVGGDLTAAAHRITEVASQVLGVERVGLWLFEEAGTRLVCVDLFEATPSQHSSGTALVSSEYPDYFAALRSGRAIPAHDARRDPRTREFLESYLAPNRIVSMLDATVRVAGDTVGVICHEHVGERRQWAPDEIAFASEVADQVAQAMLTHQWVAAESALESMEEQLRHVQRMEAVGQLAGGIAHDFNNLLMALFGHLEFAKNRLGKDHPARAEIEASEQIARRAADLTRQLLAFARRQELTQAPNDVNTLVAGFLAMVGRLIPSTVEVVFHPAEEPSTVHVDQAQIELVLLNLCLNAKDAMPDGGRIEISADRDASGRSVEICVSDTGPGIPVSERSRIFEPFYTTKEPGRGTGLGLATSYGIISQHGGSITVDASPSGGARFTITLPREIGGRPAAQVSGHEDSQPSTGSETIILADDDAMVRSVTRRILEQAGYRVLSGVDGEEAIRLYEEHRRSVDLIILDAVMPRLDGPSTIRRLRDSGEDPKVLLITGYGPGVADDLTSPESGVRVLPKPFHRGELLRAVRMLLDR